MLRERILDMFREQDPDVRKVIARGLGRRVGPSQLPEAPDNGRDTADH